MRTVSFNRPFIAGVVTDQPAYKLGPQNSAGTTDGVAPRGLIRQRHGWKYYGDNQVSSAENLTSIYRNRFVLNGNTRTMVSTNTTGDIYSVPSTGAETKIFDGASDYTVGSVYYNNAYYARTVYRDQVVFCCQNGLSPARFWSGSLSADQTLSATPAAFNMDGAQLIGSGGGTLTAPERGTYAYWKPATAQYGIKIYPRVLESDTSGTDYVTLEDINSTTVGGTVGAWLSMTGMAWPGTTVYEAGTASFNFGTLTITGYGTNWSDSALPMIADSDIVVLIPGGGADAQAFSFGTISSDTSLTVVNGGDGTTVSECAYRIQRRMPCKDAQSHKDSLFSTGYLGYANRVWVGPQGWNPALPPGDLKPFNPGSNFTRSNDADFTLDYIDVPASYDGDSNVAILSSPDPLVVLKRKDARGIGGEYPTFNSYMLPEGEGAGCIDIKSAWNLSPGPVWAGENGIYIYAGGRVNDITSDKIAREWQALTSEFTYGGGASLSPDYCTIGEKDQHLFVSIATSGGTVFSTKIYDLRTQAWISNGFTNHKARCFFTSRIDTESEKLLWVGDDDQGRIMDSSEVIEPSTSGKAKDGDGTSPALDCYTGEGLDGAEEIDSESRVLDVAVSANVLDAGAAGASTVSVKLISAGSLYTPAAVTTTLGTINSDTVDRPDRTLFTPVNQEGRTHQIRVTSTLTGTDDDLTKIEIPEITMTVQDLRART